MGVDIPSNDLHSLNKRRIHGHTRARKMRRALLVLVPFLSLGSSDGIDELFSLNVITHSNESSGRLQPLGFLTLVPDEFGTCLDGSPPGYYYRPGVGAGADKWMISIESGGWCYSEADCAGRAESDLGSSKSWPSSRPLHGLLGGDERTNPAFHNWNVIDIMYCDGGSFTGDRREAVVVNGAPLFFRGRRIMANLMLHFSQRFPTFYVATHVLLSGCSAGGLSALIHAHRVASFFSGTTVFKVLVDGGLFFDDVIDHRHIHPHITDTLANYRGALGRTPPADGLTYRHQMQSMCRLHDCSSGLHPSCLAAYPSDESWRCLFGMNILEHMDDVPVLILNSLVDTWQLFFVYGFPSENIVSVDNATVILQEFAGPVYSHLTGKLFALAERTPNFNFVTYSCIVHGQAFRDFSWLEKLVGGYDIASLVTWWYVDSIRVKVMDQLWTWPQLPHCPPIRM